MSKLFGLSLLLLVHPVYSAGLTTVESESGYCAKTEDRSAICYEWALNSSPSIRFVAYGYEDGIEYSFYQLLPNGSYEHLLRVHPVLQDNSHPGTLFWGYPWDIRDIALTEDHQNLLATYQHDIVDDGEVYSPEWQQSIPAVLFIGQTTQPQMTVELLKFNSANLQILRSAAGG